MSRTNVVTTTLTVEHRVVKWGQVASKAYHAGDNKTYNYFKDLMLDAEDDVVNTASYVYIVDHSFGDEATFNLYVSTEEPTEDVGREFSVLDDGYDPACIEVAVVEVIVRGARSVF